MEDLGRQIREKLHQTKLDLMGSEGFYLLGYTRGRQVAFGGPYSSVELLRMGFRHRKKKNSQPQKSANLILKQLWGVFHENCQIKPASGRISQFSALKWELVPAKLPQ